MSNKENTEQERYVAVKDIEKLKTQLERFVFMLKSHLEDVKVVRIEIVGVQEKTITACGADVPKSRDGEAGPEVIFPSRDNRIMMVKLE